ncbi:MAG: TM0106 family RecB-like putative nuclease, partial [Thaumarchaeota archaeon]|nr:TM0106 family RecB-like putative nuclease [Nitrososphaerota archaeon]
GGGGGGVGGVKNGQKTCFSDKGNFLDRKLKFLVRSGLVLKYRNGRSFTYSINPVFRIRVALTLRKTTTEQILQRYRNSPEHQFYQKYASSNITKIDPGPEIKRAAQLIMDANPVQLESYEETSFIDELSSIYGIGPATSARFRTGGIDTIKKILDAGPKGLARLVGCSPTSAQNFYIRAKATHEKIVIPVKMLEPLDENAVFVDIETDLTQSLVWLIGIYFKKTGEFLQLFADNSRPSELKYEMFLDRLNGHPGRIYTFSGTRFDERGLKNRLTAHRLDYSSLPEFADVYHDIHRSVVFPLKSYSLKSIAGYFGYEYRHPELDGFAVAIEYMSNYQQSKSKKLLRSLLEYNEDDIRSLPWILDRISSIEESLELTAEIDSAEVQFICKGCGTEYARADFLSIRFCQVCGAHRSSFRKKD